MPRTIVYVDGFNLYYGALKGTPHKWLNLEALFRKLLSSDRIVCIKYFTSKVTSSAAQRQAAYLNAIETLGSFVQVLYGEFKLREHECRVQACKHPGNRTYKKPDEKQTDVAIAVEMLDDVIEDRCDKLVLVSGDSDLVPALRWIKQRHSTKKSVVYIPVRQPATAGERNLLAKRTAACELRRWASTANTLPFPLLRISQFPPVVTDAATGTRIHKPSGW